MLGLRLSLCFLLIAIASQSYAANSEQDAVYLKNGSVLRGHIIEHVPGEYVRIQTSGGSEFKVKVTDIEIIKKEPPAPVAKKKHPLLAAAMSIIIPGSGHFYTGDYALGATYFSLFIAGIAISHAGYEDNILLSDRGILDADEDDWKTRFGHVLWVNALADSAADAYTSAKKYNERNQLRARLRFTPMTPTNKGIGAMLSYSF